MFTHTATIGRNVGAVMMHDVAWQVFQGDVLDAMFSADQVELSVREGRGSWRGQVEPSAAITMLSHERMSDEDFETLVFRLQDIAKAHKQEAIALSVNVEALLITPVTRCHSHHRADCGV